MFKGRLGLDTARVPHADRHGLLWLERGELCVIDGCLHFSRGPDSATPQIDQIPHQAVSMILLGPGSSVTHDALRLLARHGTLMAAVGQDGVRSYTALPLLPDRSDVARRQAELWGNPRRRISVARHMYALRLGEILPQGVDTTIDRLVRREAAQVFRKQRVIDAMIDCVKKVLRTEEIDGASDDRDA
jgi:CRISPR-associated protein Cas1